MKEIFKIILGLTFLTFSSLLHAQDVEALPNDPRIKTGKLSNGLTYYVIKNSAQKGYANFSISQKVGTTLEGADEKGMFKALELLATRGTRNFTDSTITQYFRAINVDNNDVLFKTGAEDLTYQINNVPVTNSNVVDSTLLILYNWLSSINIDEEDVNNVMPVLKNTIAGDWDAEGRMKAAVLNELYPNTSYASSLTVDEMSKMKPYSSKELRRFYYQWCRPELQSVFVVGDVDETAIENKIKSIFSIIPKPLQEVDREYFTPKKFNGTKVIIEQDPEYNKTKVTINLLKSPLLKKYRNSTVPYIQDFMNSAIISMLYSRVDDRILSQNLPIMNVKIEQGNFMEIQNSDNFSITFETQPDMVYSAVSFFSVELDRLARYGFTRHEFEASRRIYYRDIENIYDNRSTLNNNFYFNRALKNYLGDYTLASVEMNFEVIKNILFTLSVQQINSYANALLGQKDNIIITCVMPKIKEMRELSKERIHSSFVDALALSSTESNIDGYEVKWPLFSDSRHTATIVYEATDNILGSYVIKLSNGATVVLKSTIDSEDKLSFKAVSKGGFSLIDNANIGNEFYLNDIIKLGGLGELSNPSLDKLFTLYNVSMNSYITPNTEYLDGAAGASHGIERLFQLANLSITSRREDNDAFNVYKKSKIYEAMHYRLSPLDVFKDSVAYYNNSNKSYVKASSPQQIRELEYLPIFNASKSRFSNVADFIFIFSGKVDMLKFKELALKYIGSIPRENSGPENWLVQPNYNTKGNVTKRFLHQMVVPRTYVSVTRSIGVDYDIKSSVLAKITEEYLNRLYINGSIKNLSSKSTMNASLQNYPENIVLYKSTFETDSAGADKIINIVNRSLESVVNYGVEESLYNSIKKDLASEFTLNSTKSSYWTDVLAKRYLFERDFHTNFLSTLANITQVEFRDYIQALIESGNKVVVIMEGTKEDVKSKMLFEENEFIRDFFEL